MVPEPRFELGPAKAERILSGVRAWRPETPGEKQQVRMLPEPLPSPLRKPAIPRFLELFLRSGRTGLEPRHLGARNRAASSACGRVAKASGDRDRLRNGAYEPV